MHSRSMWRNKYNMAEGFKECRQSGWPSLQKLWTSHKLIYKTQNCFKGNCSKSEEVMFDHEDVCLQRNLPCKTSGWTSPTKKVILPGCVQRPKEEMRSNILLSWRLWPGTRLPERFTAKRFHNPQKCLHKFPKNKKSCNPTAEGVEV